MESRAEHPHRIYFGDFAPPFLLRWGKTCFLLTDSHSNRAQSNLVTTFLAREWPSTNPWSPRPQLSRSGPGNRACVSGVQAAEEGRRGVSASHRRTRIEGERNKLVWDGNLEVFLRFPEMGQCALKFIQLGSFRGHPMPSVPGTPTGPWPRGGEGVPTLSPPARAPGRRCPRSAGRRRRARSPSGCVRSSSRRAGAGVGRRNYRRFPTWRPRPAPSPAGVQSCGCGPRGPCAWGGGKETGETRRPPSASLALAVLPRGHSPALHGSL